MIYRRDIELKEWCYRHKIQVISGTCSSCGTRLDTTVPMETKEGYGLIGEIDCCDDPRPPYTFVLKDENLSRKLKDIILT